MRDSGRWAARTLGAAVFAAVMLAVAACDAGPALDTRTFEVQYLSPHQVDQLIAPYVFTDRERGPGMMSPAEGAVTVRETPDNLEKIARVLEEYDRPKPTIMLTFQIIEADGNGDSDPAIADVEAELRRLFRFEGYDLVSETQIAAIQDSRVAQNIGDYAPDGDGFRIRTGVTEVRQGGENATITVEVELAAAMAGTILETRVTIPAGHSVVLGTSQAPAYEGALILVVRAEIVEPGTDAPGGD